VDDTVAVVVMDADEDRDADEERDVDEETDGLILRVIVTELVGEGDKLPDKLPVTLMVLHCVAESELLGEGEVEGANEEDIDAEAESVTVDVALCVAASVPDGSMLLEMLLVPVDEADGLVDAVLEPLMLKVTDDVESAVLDVEAVGEVVLVGLTLPLSLPDVLGDVLPDDVAVWLLEAVAVIELEAVPVSLDDSLAEMLADEVAV
jgi:hypothetical protein